jgi:amino acid transporter
MNSLKRDVTLSMLVFYGLGNILGAGIYVLIGKIAGISGIYMPISFLLACVVILFTALSYAELSSRYPHSVKCHQILRQLFHQIYFLKAPSNSKLPF